MTGFPAASGHSEVIITIAPTVPPARTESAPVRHEVVVVDGRFTSASCSCGWRSAGRRSRATVRGEARDHSLLYADGRTAAAE